MSTKKRTWRLGAAFALGALCLTAMGTTAGAVTALVFGADGSLALEGAKGVVLWSPKPTPAGTATVLEVTDTGFIELLGSAGAVLWRT
jgi:hypothetical protein